TSSTRCLLNPSTSSGRATSSKVCSSGVAASTYLHRPQITLAKRPQLRTLRTCFQDHKVLPIIRRAERRESAGGVTAQTPVASAVARRACPKRSASGPYLYED